MPRYDFEDKLKTLTSLTSISPLINGFVHDGTKDVVACSEVADEKEDEKKDSSVELKLTQDQLNDWLFQAVSNENIQATKEALGQGADINFRDEDGWTPLHAAAWGGNTRIVKLLLKKGALVNTQNNKGDTPLVYAVVNNRQETVVLLKEHGAVEITQDPLNEQLFEAVKANDIEAVKNAIEKGADLKCQGEYGWTPLHMASYWGHTEIAKILIDSGALLNAKNKCGITPLHIAAGERNGELVNLLVDHGGKL